MIKSIQTFKTNSASNRLHAIMSEVTCNNDQLDHNYNTVLYVHVLLTFL